MKFKCKCNHIIVDQTDCLPYKGYVIPDKEWFNFLDAIDDGIEKSGPSAEEKEEALMKVRRMAIRISKLAYQCNNCGRLYVSDGSGELHEYKSASEAVSKVILDI